MQYVKFVLTLRFADSLLSRHLGPRTMIRRAIALKLEELYDSAQPSEVRNRVFGPFAKGEAGSPDELAIDPIVSLVDAALEAQCHVATRSEENPQRGGRYQLPDGSWVEKP